MSDPPCRRPVSNDACQFQAGVPRRGGQLPGLPRLGLQRHDLLAHGSQGRWFWRRSLLIVCALGFTSVVSGEESSVRSLATDGVGTPSSIRVVRDLVYATRPTGPLHADLYLPDRDPQAASDAKMPAVLMIHGGAWAAGLKTHSAWHARRLARAGFAAFAIEYRLAPVHKFPAQLEDCRAALAWLARAAPEYSIDEQALGAFGYSAGGHLACLMAAQDASFEGSDNRSDDAEIEMDGSPTLKAVVAGGAPCEFRYEPLRSHRLAFWLGGTRREAPNAYADASPAKFVNAHCPPVFFFHGDRDRVVPTHDPRRMHSLLKGFGVPTELWLVPGAGHIGAYANRAAMQASIRFLRQYLSTDASEEPDKTAPSGDASEGPEAQAP